MAIVSGCVDGEGIHTQGASIRVTSGDVSMTGDFLGNTTLRCISGAAALAVLGEQDDYNIKTSVISGDIWVGGLHNPGGLINARAPHSIDASVVSGEARITFRQ
jgi:hypothetical protein